jgi:hypothetical protein
MGATGKATAGLSGYRSALSSSSDHTGRSGYGDSECGTSEG